MNNNWHPLWPTQKNSEWILTFGTEQYAVLVQLSKVDDFHTVIIVYIHTLHTIASSNCTSYINNTNGLFDWAAKSWINTMNEILTRLVSEGRMVSILYSIVC